MALIMIEGFDHYGATSKIVGSSNGKWTSGSVNSLVTGRFAGQAANVAQAGNVKSDLGVNLNPIIVGFALKANFLNYEVLFLGDGSIDHLRINLNANGQIYVQQGSGGSTILGTSTRQITVGAWHYIEVYASIADSGGRVRVFVDEAEWLDIQNIDTKYSSNAYVRTIQLRNYIFDDLYVLDTSGATNNTFLGECRVCTQFPAGDVAKGWTTWDASSDHYVHVDDSTIDDDSTYIKADIVGTEDRFSIGSLPGSGIGTIRGVQLVSRARKDDANPRYMKHGLKSNATTWLRPTHAQLATAYDYIRDVKETNPDGGGAWTAQAVNAVELVAQVTDGL